MSVRTFEGGPHLLSRGSQSRATVRSARVGSSHGEVDWKLPCSGRGKGEGRDVYVYFDNTEEADCALGNAHRLGELLAAG